MRLVNRERKATVNIYCPRAYVRGAASLQHARFKSLKARDRRERTAREWRTEDVCRAAVEGASLNIRLAVTDGDSQETEVLKAIVT